MQMQEIVIGLPKFNMDDMQNVCEACQFGKQSRHAFSKERNVSGRPLEVVHLDVWGPTRTVRYAQCPTLMYLTISVPWCSKL